MPVSAHLSQSMSLALHDALNSGHASWAFLCHCINEIYYVPCNLRICAISRLCCAFSESRDCALYLRDLEIAQYICATIVFAQSPDVVRT